MKSAHARHRAQSGILSLPASMWRRSPHQRLVARALVAAGVTTALLSGGTVGLGLLPDAEAATASGNLVVNGTFDADLAGWRTNATQQVMVIGPGGGYARLSPTTNATVVLNDAENTVVDAVAGSTYQVSAKVRTATPGVDGILRVREVLDKHVIVHTQYFQLPDTQWHQVEMTVTTSHPTSSLDLNVVAWHLASNQSVDVDDVSMVALAEAPAESGTEPSPTPTWSPSPTPEPTAEPSPSPSATADPTPTPEPSTSAPSRSEGATRAPVPGGSLTNGCALSARGIPECGTLFGAAVGGNDDPSAFESQVGGTIGVRRTFFSSGQINGAVNIAKADKAAGRVSWMSFKLPYSWSEMKNGKGDAWARDVATKLGAVDGTVWLAFHHEPEKDGAVKDWVAIQRRLAPIVHDAAPNVAFSIILMGYHQFYGADQYSMENMWPGDGLVDIIGFDIYNHYGLTKNGSTITKTTDLAKQYIPQISAFAEKHDVAWGLAETAFTDQAAKDDPQWLARTYQQVSAGGGVAMSYFNTTLNSQGSWVLASSSKKKLYASVLSGTPRLD